MSVTLHFSGLLRLYLKEVDNALASFAAVKKVDPESYAEVSDVRTLGDVVFPAITRKYVVKWKETRPIMIGHRTQAIQSYNKRLCV